MKNSCLTYAIGMKLAFGGRIRTRKSKACKYLWHFMHESVDGVLTHWQPIEEKTGWRAVLEPWFEGYIKTGDTK